MRRAALFVPLAFLLAVSGLTLPRFSTEYAVPCKQCHVNPNGGGMRNEFGNHAMAFSELCLPQTKKFFVDKYRSPRLSEAATIGFDSRYLVFDDLSLFRMQTDAFVNIEPMHGISYQVRFWEQGIMENYALLQFDDQRHYVKVGRFYPAYGLRAADHTALVRTATGHTPSYYLDGISLGTEFVGTQVVAELFDRNGQGIYGLHAYRPFSVNPFGLLVGASLRISEEVGNPFETAPYAKSVFGGVSFDRFTAMGEFDLVGKGNDGLAVYGNLTTRLEYGLYLVTEYNFLDSDRGVSDGFDEFTRVSLEIFPMPFVELRPSYTRYSGRSQAEQKEYDWFLQVHFGY
jgi:hypothetical protein